jgi:hypothetical protein
MSRPTFRTEPSEGIRPEPFEIKYSTFVLLSGDQMVDHLVRFFLLKHKREVIYLHIEKLRLANCWLVLRSDKQNEHVKSIEKQSLKKEKCQLDC